MTQFNIARYLKQFRLLIFLLAVVGSLGIYTYARYKQTYTATVVIRYTNYGASKGLAPDGKPIDVQEIYSPTVVDAALKELDYDLSIDDVRANCHVEAVIPESDQTLIDALLEKGQESTYQPDTYRVSFQAERENYARDLLDAIIKNYCDFYTEKYVEQPLQENKAVVLADGSYDYVESVNILQSTIEEMMDFLSKKQYSQPRFRSVRTGCSFEDLYEIYSYLFRSEIPSLFSEILNNGASKDIELLKTRLDKDCQSMRMSIDNIQEQLDDLDALMDNLISQSKAITEYNTGEGGASAGSFILNNIDRNGGTKRETEYDVLMKQYIALRQEYEWSRIVLEHTEYLIRMFETERTPNWYGQRSPEHIQQHIDGCVALLNAYYELVAETCEELSSVTSAEYLTMVTTISTRASIGITRYIAVAVVLFLVVGVFGAILLGRGIEILESSIFVDRSVDLPNRMRCDLYIEEHYGKMLPDNYACIVLAIDLAEISREYGRETGDAVLSDFAGILKGFRDLYGFLAYNGGGYFFAFFEDCPRAKLNAIFKGLRLQVSEHNRASIERKIAFSSGTAISTEDQDYRIRHLLRLALQRQKEDSGRMAKKAKAEEPAGTEASGGGAKEEGKADQNGAQSNGVRA